MYVLGSEKSNWKTIFHEGSIKSERVLVYLHGAGEFGKEPKAQYRHPGIATVLRDKIYQPEISIALPCCDDSDHWEPQKLKIYFDDLRYKLKINDIDLLGFSRGGRGVYEYLSKYDDIRAAAVVAARPPSSEIDLGKTPLLLIHGDNDPIFDIEDVISFFNHQKEKRSNVTFWRIEGDHYIVYHACKNKELYSWYNQAGGR